jgi:hypothetical protein
LPLKLAATPPPNRRMSRAELMGSHTHFSCSGIGVHVWIREGTYLARGSFQGKSFGETLAPDAQRAAARLRQILNELDNGVFVRPTERRKRLISNGKNQRSKLRDLVAEFLADKRRSRGLQTAQDYRSRLAPVLDFAELAENSKRWPLAMDIDVDFGKSLRAFLHQYCCTRNGRPGCQTKALSGRQIVNVLECLRTVLHWARSARIRKLPADWIMPLTADLIGRPPAKNPMRADPLPQAVRVQMVTAMDRWQLSQLATSLVLPLRPGEAAGLLIGDVNFDKGWLEFGEHLKDVNFTKGKTSS